MICAISWLTFCYILDRPYVVELVDLVRFDSDGKIAQLKEFFDSEHIHSHLDEHDSKTKDKE